MKELNKNTQRAQFMVRAYEKSTKSSIYEAYKNHLDIKLALTILSVKKWKNSEVMD